MSRTVTVSSPAMPSLLGAPALEFRSLEGDEGLGRLFRYAIELQTPDNASLSDYVTANVPIKDLVGKEFSVVIELDGMGFGLGVGAGTREINGFVTSARFVRSEERRSIYEVVIEPWLVLATRTSDYKIFQNKTPLEIIREVLADYGFPVEVRVSHSYPQRIFQVQYGERDFSFVSRLMEEFGIYYFFEHSNGAHRMVLVDDAGAHQPFASAAYQAIRFQAESVKIDEEYCNHFDVTDTLASGAWVTDDFDFTKPKAKLQQISKMPRKTGNNDQEMYRWPGDYADPEEGRTLARVRMEEAGAVGKRANGSGNLRAMVPGCTFRLQHHPQDSSNREWLIIGATLSLHESGSASGQATYSCETRFYVQPANDTYRSPQRHEKPRTTGPQTAIVTGPPGQEIWTNEYGQVKLSFHWNRYCTKDQNSSCWIRVSYPWAGNGFGSIAIPRIGQEVIVDFENGDPDRPIISGRVYNALNMPPWELPANATQSGVLTRSSLEGARGKGMKNGPGDANALRFEDKKGQEQLWLHAQKDQLTEVEHDEDKWVGNDRRKTVDRDETSVIHRDRTETVDHDETITVHNDRHEQVDGNEDVRIGGNQDLTVEKTKTETIQKFSIQNVGLARMENVGLAYNRNVGAAMATTVGLARTDIVGMSWSQSIGRNYEITVADQYSVTCGKASFLMNKDGLVEIKGDKIRVNGQTLTDVTGGKSGTKWEDTGITHETPGRSRTHAAQHSLVGPASKPSVLAPAEQDCQECKNAAKSGTGGSISFARGTERLAHTDFVLQAPLPITWTRHYNSGFVGYDSAGELGARWVTPYTVALHTLGLDKVRYLASDGRTHDYPVPAVGEVHVDPIEELLLRRTSATEVVIERGPDWHEVFEWAGSWWRPIAYRTPQGNRIEMRYSEERESAQPQHDIIPERPDAHGLPAPAALPKSLLSDVLSYQGEMLIAHAQVEFKDGRIAFVWEVRDGERTRRLAAYRYDEAGDLVQALDENALMLDVPTQAVRSYTYGNHLLTRYTDRTGRAMNLQWSGTVEDAKAGRARAVREWADDGSFDTRLAWAKTGAATVTDALGHSTVHHVDRLGYTRQIDHPDGTIERLERDAACNVTAHHHPDGSVEHFSYQAGADGRSHLVEHLRADGSRIAYSWDAQGRLGAIVDPVGGRWTRTYTAAGLLATQTDALGRVTRHVYDDKNQLVEIIDPKGASKKLAYTADGQLASFTDCSGHTSRWAYDAQGRQQATTDAAGRKTEYVYEHGQLAAIVHPDKTETRLERDAEGRLFAHIDPLERKTNYHYNAAGLIQQRVQGGHSLRYEWDKLARLSALVNENGARYGFSYDPMGRLVEERDFDKQVTRYLHKPQAVRQHTGHWFLHHEYDPMGRLLRRQAEELQECSDGYLRPIPDQREQIESFQYDPAGRLVAANNNDARLQWFYDPVGNVVREHQHYDFLREPPCHVWQHEYDELDQRIATVRSNGSRQQWLTYGSGHVHGLMLDGEELVGFERDKLHRETARIQGNGLTQHSVYDPAGRLKLQRYGATPITGKGEAGTPPPPSLRGIQREYAYDPSGQLQTINDARRGMLAYKYDAVGRLVEARNGLGLESFEFDPAGNLLGEPQRVAEDLAAAQAQVKAREWGIPGLRPTPTSALLDNLLRKFGDASYEHDERGNLLKAQNPGQRSQVFEWDGFGRLRRFETLHDSEMRYFYDPLGRRIGKESCAVVLPNYSAGSGWRAAELHRINTERGYGMTTFGWDGDALAWERSARALIHYLYEPGASFVPMVQVRREAEGNQWGPVRKAWYQCDHLGTPMELTDDKGKIVWEGDYKAFGKAKATSFDGFTNNIRFQGQYFDEESGLHYNRYRYYDPLAGRYLSKDPIKLLGGFNVYSYAERNPISFLDPKGLSPNASKSSKDEGFIVHGNWCGPNWTGGQREAFNYSAPSDHYLPPTDYTDASCQRHDKCFATCRELNKCDAVARAACMTSCNSALVSAQRFGFSSGTSFATSLSIWLAIKLPPKAEKNDPSCGP